MQGNMWVESEVSKGSRFYFTITSQISHSTMDSTLSKMSPFAKRSILFVDTLRDRTGVAERIKELGLRPYVVHEVGSLANKEKCPHFDTIVVDSLSVVGGVLICVLVWRLTFRFRPNALGNMSISDISRSSCWRLPYLD